MQMQPRPRDKAQLETTLQRTPTFKNRPLVSALSVEESSILVVLTSLRPATETVFFLPFPTRAFRSACGSWYLSREEL